MDKLQWFKFTPSDWTMGKISRMSNAIQGEYIRFCCTYWNKRCVMSESDAQIEFSKVSYRKLLDANILTIKDGYVKILFLDKQMEDIAKISEQASIAGKASARARAKAKQKSTPVQRNVNDSQQNKNKTKKEDVYREFAHLYITRSDYFELLEIYDKSDIDEIIDRI